MKTPGFATLVPCVALIAGTSSCVNLSPIYKFSTATTTALDHYADIGFSATGYCREIICLDPSSYQDGTLRKVEKCDCHDFATADLTIRTINQVLSGYWESVGNLAGGTNPSVSYGSLAMSVNALAENQKLGVTAADVSATRDIVTQLSSEALSAWRRKKIEQIIERSHSAHNVVVEAQKRNIAALQKILRDERLEIQATYDAMAAKAPQGEVKFLLHTAQSAKDSALLRQDRLLTNYALALGKIAKGEENLYETRQQLSGADFIRALLATTVQITELIKEFRELDK
jgi:hypothetical protein